MRSILHDLPKVLTDKPNSFTLIAPSKLGVKGSQRRLYTKPEDVEVLVLPPWDPAWIH